MSLQNIMNVLRDEKKCVYNQTREQNREGFQNSSPSNKKLLALLSQVKDYMGFWLKSGLNDFAKNDPIMKQMILEISNNNLTNFMNIQTQGLWNDFKPGLEVYAQKDISRLYKRSIDSIVNGLSTMAKADVIKNPSKIDFPVFSDEGKSPSILTDYKNGAPFMIRPDTFVRLPKEKHLVEVRGLNLGIADNDFLKDFLMSHYRKFGTLANGRFTDQVIEKSMPNDNKPQQRRLELFTKPMSQIELTNPTTERKGVPKSSAKEENKNEIEKYPIIRKRS